MTQDRQVQNSSADLALIRQLEALGFRAWPARDTFYDGAWMVRLTPDHPSSRLNSVNPVDPGDYADLDGRIARLREEFAARGRSLGFRMSPLGAPQIAEHLNARGFIREKPVSVMCRGLDAADFTAVSAHEPLENLETYLTASMNIHAYAPTLHSGLGSVLSAIRPQRGLFVLEQDGAPVSTLLCVRDGAMAGLLEVATHVDHRGQGHARRLILAALKWAYTKGARGAWLQVEQNNAPATGLYGQLGFTQVYDYHFLREPVRGEP